MLFDAERGGRVLVHLEVRRLGCGRVHRIDFNSAVVGDLLAIAIGVVDVVEIARDDEAASARVAQPVHRVVTVLVGHKIGGAAPRRGHRAQDLVLIPVIQAGTLIDDPAAACLRVVDLRHLMPAVVTVRVRHALRAIPEDPRVDAVGARDLREAHRAVVCEHRYRVGVALAGGLQAHGEGPVQRVVGGVYPMTARTRAGPAVAHAVEGRSGHGPVLRTAHAVAERVVAVEQRRHVVFGGGQSAETVVREGLERRRGHHAGTDGDVAPDKAVTQVVLVGDRGAVGVDAALHIAPRAPDQRLRRVVRMGRLRQPVAGVVGVGGCVAVGVDAGDEAVVAVLDIRGVDRDAARPGTFVV